jgi:hypothetical protein
MCANNAIAARAGVSVPGMEVSGDAMAPQKIELDRRLGNEACLSSQLPPRGNGVTCAACHPDLEHFAGLECGVCNGRRHGPIPMPMSSGLADHGVAREPTFQGEQQQR